MITQNENLQVDYVIRERLQSGELVKVKTFDSLETARAWWPLYEKCSSKPRLYRRTVTYEDVTDEHCDT